MNETPHNPHQHLLEQQLPTWARQASPEHWQRLREGLSPAQGLADAQAPWFANARPALREAVEASQARLMASRQALGRALKGLQQISELCEPLLQQRLATLGVSASVRSTELLRVQRDWSWSGLRFLYRSERASLLQAALQNFSDTPSFGPHSAVALAGDISVQPLAVSGNAPGGYDGPGAAFMLRSEAYQVKALALSPEQLASACRTLDLGQQYQAHLQQVFEGERLQQVRALSMDVLRDRLRLAASLARLRQQIDAAAHATLEHLLAGNPSNCWQLTLFGFTVHDVTLIDAGAAGLLLFLPDQQPALHSCADVAGVTATLAGLLQDESTRQQFLGYLPMDQRARFVDVLQQNLGADADLHLERQPISAELFGHLHDCHVARLKAEARLLAVPTADADEQARKQRLAEWESLGLDALMLAGFFIPAVGTLMLAVTACQLLDEAYEGYAAWSIGDRHEALQHLEAIGLNLALMGGLHVAGKVIPKVFGSPLMERLEPVRKADGSRRLWQPDLAPYRSQALLPDTLQANSQGQWLHEGRHFIRIDGHLYEQRLDAALQRWRIIHPGDPEAYQPLLEHNAAGAWRGEHERPQDWPLAQLVRRLGGDAQTLGDDDLHLATRISGVDENALRRVHLHNGAMPAKLADSLARLRAARQTLIDPQAGFAQLYDPDAALQPQAQRLLDAHPRLPRPVARWLAARVATEVPAEQPLPSGLQASAKAVLRDLPMNRALEGLWLPQLANADSERLLWRGLRQLPGWPAQLRLELRANSPQGALLRAIGDTTAAQRCTVFKSAEGYEAYRGERPAGRPVDHDLCRAVQGALPAATLEKLGVQGERGLLEHLQAWVDSDRRAATRHVWRSEPASWGGGALRGGDITGVYPQLSLRGSQRGRYQRVFPSANDDEFTSTLTRWRRQGRTPEIELAALEDRLQQLRGDLAAWAGGQPRREEAVRRIVSAWRRDSLTQLGEQQWVHSLNLGGLDLLDEDLATLALPNDFQHIEELELSGNPQLQALHPEFIERFPRLHRLNLSDCRFAQLPEVAAPLRLTSLDLQNNRITWDDSAQQRLERAANLRFLDLSDNPLLRAPSLAGNPELQFVQMGNASLTALPDGLHALPDLEVLDLSDNQLIELPEQLDLPEHVAQSMQLESDWLSPRVRQQIDAYYRQHGIDLLVAEHDYAELLGEAGPEQRALWARLQLDYRRQLRALLVNDRYLSDPDAMRRELWRRLQRIDSEPPVRELAYSQPAWRILDLTL